MRATSICVSTATVVVLILALSVSAVPSLVDLGYTQLQGRETAMGVTQWLGVPFAAPPLGPLRFSAPADPLPTTDVVNCTAFRPICLPRQPSDFTMKPNRRFTVSEDCLFVNIFAPANATQDSQLPVMYFAQGGGFQSNSNANFNGSQLALFGDIIVIQVNYRVGPFGFAQSREIVAGGSLNNGIKDIIQGLVWTERNIAKFGGNPDQIVISGDSAGATAVALLLPALKDKYPSLIKGAILESASFATIRTLDQGQEMYNCLVNASGCFGSNDTLACMRAVNASALQTEQCQFNPHLDDDLIKTPSLQSYAAGVFLHVPTIWGNCQDEGTKNVPQSTNKTEQAFAVMQGQAFNVLSNYSLSLLNQTYLAVPQPVFNNSGVLWRQIANAHRDYRAFCPTRVLQNGLATAGVPTYNYRFGPIDPEQEQLGFGAYHTIELDAVFGPNNTDGAPPKSYFTTNAPIVNITMAYWASFVRTLDPNVGRLDGTPEWKPWSVEGRERLFFQTGGMAMEQMPDVQERNCRMLEGMLQAIETPLPQGTVVNLTFPA